MTHRSTANPGGKIPPNHGPQKAQDQGRASSSHKPFNEFLGSGDSTELTVEDISNQDTNYDADVEYIGPYEYEEAEDESTQAIKTPPRPSRKIELDELWSNGLIESMNSLRCNPGGDHRSLSPDRRGRKRKSAPSPDLHQTASIKHHTASYFPKKPSIRPKKPKKRHNRSFEGKMSGLKPDMATVCQADPMDTD